MPQDFKSAIGDYLIGVHVGSGSGSALNHIYRELFMMLAFKYFLTSFKNSIRLLFGKQAKLEVGNSRSHFSDSKSIDEQRVFIQMKFTDTKVFDTSEGLYSIHGSFRYFTAADQITFCASFF